MAEPVNNLPIGGLGASLQITGGLGDNQASVFDDSTGPGAPITDHKARARALFVTQFRQTRETGP